MPLKGIQKLRPLDYLMVGVSALIALTAALYVYGGDRGEAQVFVEGGGGKWVFPLNANETIRVPGPLGESVVVVQGGQAVMHSSPCGNQTCVAAGRIRYHGQWVACLPNAVFLRIEGKAHGDELDGSTW